MHSASIVIVHAQRDESSGNDPIVEDEVLVRMPIAQYLRDCGYKVVEAVNADEAIAA